MALSGLQVINIGQPNESTGSDSLYTAFNKTKTNFATLFANASPFNTFTGNTGITVNANSTTGILDITNSGVTYLQAGTGITLSGNTGNITISSTGGGGGGGGTVTSVSVATASASRITVAGSPIVSSGTITLDLATTGVTAGSYTYPSVTVDSYGRITTIANGASVGTVTSVGVTPGFGIQVTGSPITTSGNITILNTGVTRLTAGSGISLSGSNGNVTISTSVGSGTVTSVGLTSSSLTVSGSPIVAAGTFVVDLPSTISVGNVTANSTGGIGYATGAGGTITQITSRTTGVTINKTTGAITLVSAAGSGTFATFTVTNSTVAATDVVIVNQKSGTDKYQIFVTAITAGSFDITFATTGGTTTEQPVFNFAVIKGVTS
jgi:hypothetical protein